MGRKWVSNFSLLSYKDMAEQIAKANSEGKVVTYGSDDSVKSGGHKRFDIKTSHVTICDKEKQRESFSSGFYPNASHSGKSSAETVSHDISKMALLTGNDYEDMKGFIDFFMNDRSGDDNVM